MNISKQNIKKLFYALGVYDDPDEFIDIIIDAEDSNLNPCGTCDFSILQENGDLICVNHKSENLSDFVEVLETCKYYKGK